MIPASTAPSLDAVVRRRLEPLDRHRRIARDAEERLAFRRGPRGENGENGSQGKGKFAGQRFAYVAIQIHMGEYITRSGQKTTQITPGQPALWLRFAGARRQRRRHQQRRQNRGGGGSSATSGGDLRDALNDAICSTFAGGGFFGEDHAAQKRSFRDDLP
ncbi:MAG: hypothetical protein MJ138_06720, partial [Kiritimatiellae bacterium]|nr:hypothetical protein [Kiritimatiellia bacterium]